LLEARHKLELSLRELEAGSPLEILKKGYSVVTDEASGRVITGASQTQAGKRIRVRLSRGGLVAGIEETLQ